MPRAVDRLIRDHVRYTGDGLPGEPVNAPLPIGDPSSGVYHPTKRDIRDAIGDVASDRILAEAAAAVAQTAMTDAHGATFFAASRAALQANTATSYPVGTVFQTRSENSAFEVVASGGDLVTAGGVRLRAILRGDGSDILAMGIDRTGATDVTARMQDYLTRRAGQPAYIPDGTYKLNGTVTAPPEGVDVTCGPNVVFDMTTAPNGNYAFVIAGSVGSYFAVTAGNANTGARRIRSGSSFSTARSVGQWIKIISDDVFDAGRTNSKHGELTPILGLADAATGYIDVGIAMHADYATVPRVAVVTPIKCRWRGGRFLGAVAEQNNQKALKIVAAPDFLVEGIATERLDDRGLWIEDCPGGTVRKCDFRDTRPASTGYGVSVIDAAQDILVEDCKFRDVRHAFSTNNQGASAGIPRRITVSKNTVVGGAKARAGSMAWGNALDTHAAAEDIRFLHNTVQGCPGDVAINLECRSGEATGNLVEDCAGSGINAVNQSSQLGTVTISGNTVRRCGNGGIKVFPGSTNSLSAFKRAIVTANEIADCTGATSLLVGSSAITMSGVTVSNNTVDASPTADFHAVIITNCRAPLITGNKIRGGIAGKFALSVAGSPYATVSGNSITAAPDATTSPLTVATSSNVTVASNNVHPASGSITPAGINVTADSTAPVVTGNGTRGTGGITATGAGAVVANNT